MCTELVPVDEIQGNLFIQRDRARKAKLMKVLDRINHNFGVGRLRYLSEGMAKDWQTKFGRKSPRYTTSWDELPIALA